MNKTIIVFGGDGFCGWPTSLKLSKEGYDIVIVDNLSRRKIDVELECDSLTPIQPISKRIQTWKELTGKEIKFHNIDISVNYKRLLDLFETYKPETVIHFAEQRAAPYSMKSAFHKRYTINNNLNATNNILSAIVESGQDIHLVHLGTTGYYGYSSVGMKIPEGYLPVKVDVNGKEHNLEIMYPPNPGSIYHLTKCQDALSFSYYNKNDNVRITDLHQGIVWGTQTPETKLHEDLINRFDYDGDYGTCFLPEMKVLMNEGYYEKIKNVKKYDYVISGNCTKQKVLHKFKRKYNGDIYELNLKYKSNLPIKCTKEHPIYIGEMQRNSKGFQTHIKKLGWLTAEKIYELYNKSNKRYFAFLPKIKQGKYIKINVQKELDNLNTIIKNKIIYPQNAMSKNAIGGKGIPNKIIFNDDISRLFGYYLAEGSCTKYQTTLSFNSNEDEYIDDVLTILKKYFNINGKIKYRKNSNCCIIIINSILLTNLFKKLMGKFAKHKKIDERFIYSKSSKGLMQGYWRGDGWISGKNISFSSCNLKLIEQIQTILIGHGIPSSIFKETSFKKITFGKRISRGLFTSVILHVPYNYQNKFLHKIFNEKYEKFNKLYDLKNYIAIPIFNIEKKPYSGMVYNLEVEKDNTYLINGILVHNCLNRFLMQSQINHPLTIHGTGGQTRAFIHIKNTTECILLAVQNPPDKGEKVKVFNQTTECLNILDLAKKICDMTGAKIRYYKNPRNEDPKNDLEFENEGLLNLGLEPVTLNDALLEEVTEIANKYVHRVNKNKIICTSTWRKDIEVDYVGKESKE